MKGVIFNVRVKGNSIGMTFSLKQAEEWKRQSVNGAEIVPVRYVDPNPQAE